MFLMSHRTSDWSVVDSCSFLVKLSILIGTLVLVHIIIIIIIHVHILIVLCRSDARATLRYLAVRNQTLVLLMRYKSKLIGHAAAVILNLTTLIRLQPFALLSEWLDILNVIDHTAGNILLRISVQEVIAHVITTYKSKTNITVS